MERYLELGQLVVHTRQQVFAGLSAALARLSELGVTMTGKLPPQPQVDSRSLGADALMATPGPAEAAVQGTLDLVTRFRELLGKPAPGKGRGKPRGTMSAGPSSAGPESSRMGTDSPLGRLSIAADGALGSTSKPGAAPPLLLRGELPPRTESMYGADVSRRKSFTHGEAAEQLSPRSVPIGPAWKPDRAWVPAGVGSGDWDDASIKQERRERASKGRLSISLLLRDNNDGASVCSTGPPHSPADQTRRSSAGSSAAERDSPSSVGRGKGISLAALGDIDLEQSSLAELRRVAVDVGVPEDRVAALDDRGDLIIAIKTMAANTKKQRTEKWVQQQGDGPPRAAPLTPRGVVTPRSRKTSAGGAEHDPFAGFAGVQLRPPVPATAVPGKGHTQAPQRSPRPKQEGGIVGEKGGDAIVNLTKQAMLGRGWLDGVPQVATEAEQRLERERGWRPATSRQDALSAGAAGIELRTAPLPRTTYEYRGRMTDYLGLPCSAVGPSPPAQQVHLRFGDGTLFHWEWRDVDLRDVPGRVMLRCGEAPHLDGVYCLPQGPPSGELERLVWSSGDRRLFCTPAGYWMVSETEQGPTQCSGRLQTTAPHDGRLPQHTPAGGWQIWDGSAWTDCSAELAVPEPYVMEGVAGLLSGAQEEFERLTVQEAKQRLVQRENAAGFSIVGPPDGQGKYEVHFRDRWEVMPKRGTTSYQKGWRVPAWESAAAAAKGGRARMRFRRSIHTIIAGNRFAGRRQSAPEGPAHRLAVASREAEQQKKRRATVAHDSRRSPSLRPSSAAPSPQRTAAGRRAGEAAHSPPRSPTAQLPPLRNPAPAAQQPTPQLLTLLSVDVVRSPSGQPVSPGVLSPYSALSGREDGVSDVDSMMPPADGDGEHDGLSAAPASDAPEGRRASHQKPRRQSAAPGARARQSLRRASAVTGKLASAAAKRSGAKGGD